MKPQVGDAETNVGVSQSDADRIFDDVDSVNDDVTGDKTNDKSTTKTGWNTTQVFSRKVRSRNHFGSCAFIMTKKVN